jgi:predicted ATP-grasp superfamily ATP-dependent carboligase
MVAETSRAQLCHYSSAVSKSFVVPAPVDGTRAFAEALAEVIQREAIDYLLPTCEEVFAVGAQHSYLSTYCKVLSVPLKQLRPLHSKAEFIDILKKAHLAYPETRVLHCIEDLQSFSAPWSRVVLKPVFSRFARDVRICEREDLALQEGLCPTEADPWVAQEYLSGRRLCTYSVAHAGKLLAHVCYPVEFCLGDKGSALAFRSEENPAARAYVEQLLRSIHFSGQISLDLIEREDGSLVAIECNPRSTSGAHLFQAGDALPAALMGLGRAAKVPAGRQAQLSLPLLLMGGLLRQPRALFRALCSGREVLWSPKDRRPLLVAPWLMLYYCWHALCKGMSPTAASTYDIEWNGDLCV